MKLAYKAISKDGKRIKGTIEARDIKEAGIFLRRKELVPLSVKKPSKGFLEIFSFGNKIRAANIVFFTRQLSLMISAGLTLLQSLHILREQLENPRMIEMTEGIIQDIEGGGTFSKAISKYPQVFSPIYISLIRSAETSGLFDKILLKLADNLEKHEKLVRTIKGALIYPVVVLGMMMGVIVIMLVFVIPPLARLYQDLDLEMPLPTRIVLGLSSFVINFWPLILIATVVGFYFYGKWHKTPKGKAFIDTASLKIPIFGKLFMEQILAEFSRTCGLLIGTGVLVVDSIVQAADTTGNIIYRDGIIAVSRMVEKGVTVGDALSTNEIFPPILVQMAKIGEQTGKLDESLIKVSQYYEEEVDQTVKNLTTLMEPFIIIILGIGVGFLIISIITPIYSLVSSIK